MSQKKSKPYILIIEDDFADVTLIKRKIYTLWPESRILIANNLSDAYALYQSYEIDFFILDLNLPDAHGANTVSFVRDFAPSVKIIVLTGNVNENVVQKAKNMGADDVAIKDFIMDSSFTEILSKHY